MKTLILYVFNVLRWLDCGLNCIVFLGSYNETMSTRAARARQQDKKWGCVLCDFLDALMPGHCDRALTDYIGEDSILKE